MFDLGGPGTGGLGAGQSHPLHPALKETRFPYPRRAAIGPLGRETGCFIANITTARTARRIGAAPLESSFSVPPAAPSTPLNPGFMLVKAPEGAKSRRDCQTIIGPSHAARLKPSILGTYSM